MKILVFSDHFYPEPSAPAAHIYERAKLWSRDGQKVTVICSAPNFPEGKVYPGYTNAWRKVESLDGVRVVRVKTFMTSNEGTVLRVLDYLSYMLSAWFFSLFEEKPDVILSSSPHLFVPLAGVAAAVCKRVPHVFEIRDLWPASIAATTAMGQGRIFALLERLELWLYRRSTRILALTPSFREDLMKRGIEGDRIDVVINGANLELFKPAAEKDADILSRYGLSNKFVIGYLGTLGLAHGLENVVAVAERMRHTNACFFFVGVGAAKRQLEQRVRESSLDNVVFAPRQLKEDMPRFWSVCDASLVHLKNEAVFGTVIPSKIFESMAMALPILYVSPKGDGSRIVEREEAGLIVEPMQPDALMNAIECLMNDKEMYDRLRRNSAAAAAKYSREKQAQESLKVLVNAVKEARRPRAPSR